MSDNLDLSASITTEEPEVAATLSDLRYLVFQGLKGDTGDSAYEEAVKLGFEGTEAEWIASLKGETGANGRDGQDGAPGTPGRDGVSPTVQTTAITGGHRVTITDKAHPHGQSFDVMDGDDANVPTKLSQFTNDAGFVTAQQAAAAAPVQSVNGKTGAVEINDVPDYSTTTTGYVLAKTGANTLGWIPPYDPSSPEYSELQEWLASDAPDDVSEALLTYLTDNNLWQDGVDPAFYAALTAAARAGKLPNVTAADNGKIAIASNGAWTVGQAPVQSVNGRTGSVTVNEVPAVGGTDNKKVLTADNGTYSWEAVQSGETTKRISLYKNSQTGVYTCSMSATQLHEALPNVVLATEDYRVPVSAYSIDKDDSYVKAVFIDDRPENNAAIVWTLSAASASDLVAVTREECSIEGLPDYSHAIDGQVLTKAQDGPRWVENIPQRAASLRLLYDGTFGPDDPDLMLMGNVADAETGNAIATALYSGRIGSAVLVDVTDSSAEVVYDLLAVDYDAQTHVSTVTFARTEADCIRTATLSGSTKSAPTFGTIPLAGGGSANAVLYTQQTLTDAQQEQARENIGATASADLLSMLIPILREGLYGTDQTAAITALEIALGGTPGPEDPIETYTPAMAEGYINVNTGAAGGTSTYKHTEIIPVREGDKVYGTSFDSTYNVTIPRIRARFTAAYDANGAIYPAGGSSTQADYEEGTPFVAPAGVYGVVFSIVNSLATQVVVYVDKSERVGA